MVNELTVDIQFRCWIKDSVARKMGQNLLPLFSESWLIPQHPGHFYSKSSGILQMAKAGLGMDY